MRMNGLSGTTPPAMVEAAQGLAIPAQDERQAHKDS